MRKQGKCENLLQVAQVTITVLEAVQEQSFTWPCHLCTLSFHKSQQEHKELSDSVLVRF